LAGGESQTEPKKKSRRFYLVLFAAILAITIILGAVIFELSNVGRTSYGLGPVEIEIATDKPYYLQGENITFSIYVNNQQNWSVAYPSHEGFKIEKDGIEIYSSGLFIDYAAGRIPTFPANARTSYGHWTWDQRMWSDNKTVVQVQPGNYTLTISLDGQGYGDGNSGNCTFEIR
jgi:hypothetical protein